MQAHFVRTNLVLWLSMTNLSLQSSEDKKLAELIFETKMVSHTFDYSFKRHTDGYAVLATQAIANVVKSSFGPSGLDKMMVDDIGVGHGPYSSRTRLR